MEHLDGFTALILILLLSASIVGAYRLFKQDRKIKRCRQCYGYSPHIGACERCGKQICLDCDWDGICKDCVSDLVED